MKKSKFIQLRAWFGDVYAEVITEDTWSNGDKYFKYVYYTTDGRERKADIVNAKEVREVRRFSKYSVPNVAKLIYFTNAKYTNRSGENEWLEYDLPHPNRGWLTSYETVSPRIVNAPFNSLKFIMR